MAVWEYGYLFQVQTKRSQQRGKRFENGPVVWISMSAGETRAIGTDEQALEVFNSLGGDGWEIISDLKDDEVWSWIDRTLEDGLVASRARRVLMRRQLPASSS